MKKFIALALALVLLCSILCSCNMTLFDTTYSFEEAVIFRADGEQRVRIKNWCDYENSDMIQITLENGDVYLTHSANVILISTDN